LSEREKACCPHCGASCLRKSIIENDMLEAIIAMPDQLFYNIGIFTYVWILTNRKPPERKGKIQLANVQNGDIINYRFDVLCAIQNTNDVSGIK